MADFKPSFPYNVPAERERRTGGSWNPYQLERYCKKGGR